MNENLEYSVLDRSIPAETQGMGFFKQMALMQLFWALVILLILFWLIKAVIRNPKLLLFFL